MANQDDPNDKYVLINYMVKIHAKPIIAYAPVNETSFLCYSGFCQWRVN